MAYKILTKNGIDNSNIDGARGEYFNSGMRDGIVQGVLNEGTFIASSSNVISFDTCEIRIAGHRIVIDEPVYHTFSNAPRTDTRYAYVAQIIVGNDQSVDFSLFIQTVSTPLIQNDLYKTISGAGTYQVEIGRFTLTQSLLIEDVVRTIDVITGGTGGNSGDYIKIGQVTTTTTASGTMANVDIENVERQGEMQTDFHFDIPAPIGTTVVVAGEEQESVSFKSDPQTQITENTNNISQLSNPNLLINGDFRVNQRGLTIYKSQTNANIYSLDHWQIGTNAIGVTVAMKSGKATNYGGGIILSCTSDVPSSYNILKQYIEDYEIFQGKTLTLSCYVSNLSGSLNLRIFGTNLIKSQALQSGLNIMSVTIPSDITRLYIAISCLGVESSATIEWVKLEMGSTATPHSPRPYAEELALCQRYYQKFSPNNNYSLIALGYVYEPTILIYGVTLPVVMRTVPTLQRSGNLYIRSHSFVKVIYPTDDILFSVQGMCNNMLQVQINTSSFTFNNGEMSILLVNETSAYISFDAEIY